MNIDKGGCDTVLSQRMFKQIVAAAVDGLLRYDMLTRLSQRLNGIGHGSRTGCQSQSSYAAFKCCNPLFQNILCGICKSAVDVAGVSKTEARCRMGGIPEYIGCGLINRDCSCIGCRIGLFLSYMKL